jgi:sugar/nucleoside kinase (ribokinase family)
MRPRAVCVGDLMLDVSVRLPGPPVPGSDTPARISVQCGGQAANVAAGLAAHGIATTLVGRVGADVFGRRVMDELAGDGLELRVSVDPELPTGVCVVLVDPAGERTMLPDAGANDALASRPFPAQVLDSAAMLYVSGYPLLRPGSRPAALAAIDAAREHGCAVAVDLASAAPLADVGAAAVLEWVGGPTLLLANTDEARVLAPGRADDELAHALARLSGEAVVTHGAAGACWSDGRARIHVPASPVAVLDSTGAGDAFAAGLLAAGARGADPSTALAAAADAAARVVGRAGARES